jgi:heme/copper-type cytochrome/quinol oxidase subunit 4
MRKFLWRIRRAWQLGNIATKALIIIGILALIQTALTIFLDTTQSSTSDVAVRSVMSNIFGYVFGRQINENNNMPSKELQIIVTSFIAVVCLVVVAASRWTSANQAGAALVEIRNLMFAAIGFLISRAKRDD